MLMDLSISMGTEFSLIQECKASIFFRTYCPVLDCATKELPNGMEDKIREIVRKHAYYGPTGGELSGLKPKLET